HGADGEAAQEADAQVTPPLGKVAPPARPGGLRRGRGGGCRLLRRGGWRGRIGRDGLRGRRRARRHAGGLRRVLLPGPGCSGRLAWCAGLGRAARPARSACRGTPRAGVRSESETIVLYVRDLDTRLPATRARWQASAWRCRYGDRAPTTPCTTSTQIVEHRCAPRVALSPVRRIDYAMRRGACRVACAAR